MPFTIVRQDITKMKVDAIVNAANTALQIGGGVCGAIFHSAGAAQLQAACNQVVPIQTGKAAITPGFALPCRYIIHGAGPVYQQSNPAESERLLRATHINDLELAAEHDCQSIAFPLISSGIYGYPKEETLQVATAAIRDFLVTHEMAVSLAIFDKASFAVSERLLGRVASYIDDHYAKTYETRRGGLLEVEKEVLGAPELMVIKDGRSQAFRRTRSGYPTPGGQS